MKLILIYITLILGFIIMDLGATYASPDKGQKGEIEQTHTTQHPPHDHHESDHIKKLDEAMRRKRKDEEKSH